MHKDHKEFRFPGVSYLDYKQVEMDRVLTAFMPRLWFQGRSSVISRTADLTVEDFAEAFLEHPESFSGFDSDTTRRWLETHLLDVVNRGKSTQAVAGLRPLHGFTYRFRNSRRSRPYNADEQLYAMLLHASRGRGATTLQLLREFFFEGADRRTEAPQLGVEIDVETQALINLSVAERGAITDREARKVAPFRPPLYPEASDLLADDVLRLLRHQNHVPRTVLIDYLKILFAFHLALYHLRITKSLPALLKGSPSVEHGFFLDVAGITATPVARLAERSAASWFNRIPEFVRATFAVRKLDEFAAQLADLGKLPRPARNFFRVDELLALQGPAWEADRRNFFGRRLSGLMEELRGADGGVDEQISQIVKLGLDDFTTYIEVIAARRVKFHRQYLRECLDSLLLKNRPGAMIAQPNKGDRRFILDSRLLEVLLQLSLLRQSPGGGFQTAPLRVDEFLSILRNRYGIYIDQLPPGDGFERATITDQRALKANRDAFTSRLREIGYYSDLSDAYLTQTIIPRYTIGSTR
ncbi:methylation-associated defense system protein MAD7 [Nonomuraea sp. KM90]|uniref:methylation-associated defense system protein MAD7 n=1 Tax=Nonomuraea sp. KM90 TaxID=3457428 RepID=UPI003FCD5A27